MQIRLTLEYDGGDYSGWQIQRGQDSVQARLEAALERLFSHPVRVRSAGRTDAGVHARGQVAALRVEPRFAPPELMRALNALLPRDIAVLKACEVSDDFDPRRDARSRLYEYRVLNQQIRSPFEHRYAWQVCGPLDMDMMNAAAHLFAGEHDFAAFRTLGSGEKTTVRRIYLSRWSREAALLRYEVEANGFLRHMVRTMVAVMIEVGRGRETPGVVTRLLDGRDRGLAPACAPPCGLFLVEVRY